MNLPTFGRENARCRRHWFGRRRFLRSTAKNELSFYSVAAVSVNRIRGPASIRRALNRYSKDDCATWFSVINLLFVPGRFIWQMLISKNSIRLEGAPPTVSWRCTKVASTRFLCRQCWATKTASFWSSPFGRISTCADLKSTTGNTDCLNCVCQGIAVYIYSE